MLACGREYSQVAICGAGLCKRMTLNTSLFQRYVLIEELMKQRSIVLRPWPQPQRHQWGEAQPLHRRRVAFHIRPGCRQGSAAICLPQVVVPALKRRSTGE